MGGDLEDKILRRNIPGRYSEHVDDTDKDDRKQHVDSDDDGGNDDNDDDNQDRIDQSNSREASLSRMSHMADEGIPESVYRNIEAQRLNAPQTGVKGVLADYRQSQALAAARRTQEEIHRRDVLYRMATGRGPPGSGGGDTNATLTTQTYQSNSSDSDDDLLNDDDGFMEQFRQQRITEMRSKEHAPVMSQSCLTKSSATSKPLPCFGEIVDIDEFDPKQSITDKDGSSARLSTPQDYFLYQLSTTDSRVTIVVHTYEPSIKLCVIVNDHLDKIAVIYPHVKFIKMMASANGLDIDPVAMPIMSIYRDGQCVEVLADIAEEVVRNDGISGGERLSTSDVEMVLGKFLRPVT